MLVEQFSPGKAGIVNSLKQSHLLAIAGFIVTLSFIAVVAEQLQIG
jgi:hypothetical protein